MDLRCRAVPRSALNGVRKYIVWGMDALYYGFEIQVRRQAMGWS